MNLMNFFSGNAANPFTAPAAPVATAPAPGMPPQAPPAVPQPRNPADNGFANNPAGNGSALQQGASAPQPGQNNSSPLDQFSALFHNDPTKTEVNPLDALTKPVIEADFAKLKEQVTAANLVGQVSPELFQKAMQGDVASFTQIMNQVAQQAFLEAARFSHGIVESGIQTYNGRVEKALPSRFQDFQARVAMETANPALAHEAARPVVEALRQLAIAKNPNASPQQIAEQVQQYFKSLQAPEAPQAPTPQRDPLTGNLLQAAPEQQAWGDWFSGR